ncbi:MAG: SCO family protein [Acidobacteriota bacterium]
MTIKTTIRRSASTLLRATGHLLLGAALACAAQPSLAQDRLVEPKKMPGPLSQVTFEQNLGAQLPLDAPFVDEQGRKVVLGDFYGERPVVLAFVYYECPMLCSLILNGMAASLSVLQFTPGEEFDVVAISIDHEEGPVMARQSMADTLNRYGRQETAGGWHFLTGDEATIRQVADIAGYGYEYIPATDEWAHSSGIIVTTPEGQIAQYFYGIEYSPKDLRLAMVESASNRIGNLVDQILLYCYRYDPQVGKYTAMTMRILRLTGGLFVFGLVIFLYVSFRRDSAATAAKRPTLGAL